jgi:hypothetical protein
VKISACVRKHFFLKNKNKKYFFVKEPRGSKREGGGTAEKSQHGDYKKKREKNENVFLYIFEENPSFHLARKKEALGRHFEPEIFEHTVSISLVGG